MADPNFSGSVTYVCHHDDEGASGITINRSSGLCIREVLEQIDIDCRRSDIEEDPVLIGGPVQQQHGFVLHTRDGNGWGSSFVITEQLALTTSKDVLEAMAINDGPRRQLFALGYCGWGPGQLEQEILDNAWLTAPAPMDLLFDVPLSDRWQEAATLLGVDLSLLSSQAGHA